MKNRCQVPTTLKHQIFSSCHTYFRIKSAPRRDAIAIIVLCQCRFNAVQVYSNQSILRCQCLLETGMVDRHGEERVTLPLHQPHLDLGASSMILLQYRKRSNKYRDIYCAFLSYPPLNLTSTCPPTNKFASGGAKRNFLEFKALFPVFHVIFLPFSFPFFFFF